MKDDVCVVEVGVHPGPYWYCARTTVGPVCDRHRSQFEERADEFGPFDWQPYEPPPDRTIAQECDSLVAEALKGGEFVAITNDLVLRLVDAIRTRDAVAVAFDGAEDDLRATISALRAAAPSDGLKRDIGIAARAMRSQSWPLDMAEEMEQRAYRIDRWLDAESVGETP